MNNSLDTSGTHQQMVSRLSAFSKAAKAHSEDQRLESKQALDQHLESKQALDQHLESKQVLDQRPKDNREDSMHFNV